MQSVIFILDSRHYNVNINNSAHHKIFNHYVYDTQPTPWPQQPHNHHFKTVQSYDTDDQASVSCDSIATRPEYVCYES